MTQNPAGKHDEGKMTYNENSWEPEMSSVRLSTGYRREELQVQLPM